MVRLAPATEAATGVAVVGDEEALPFRDASFDLAVSLLALHGVNDLPGALVQIRRALKPDGLFLGCVLGGATLTELRQAFAAAEAEVEGGVSPRVAPFADVRDLGALLQRAGFALPVTDVESVAVRYADPFGLMRDLRAMGLTNALAERRRTPLRRATLLRGGELYAERFADADGRVPRHLRDRLAVGLGAAREPAEAAAAGLGQDAARRRARRRRSTASARRPAAERGFSRPEKWRPRFREGIALSRSNVERTGARDETARPRSSDHDRAEPASGARRSSAASSSPRRRAR